MFDRLALRSLSYGIYIVSAIDEGKLTGCVANSMIQISTTTVVLSLNQKSNTNKVIKSSGLFSVSVLPEEIDPNIISVFGFSTGSNVEKFKNIEYKMKNNLPVVSGAVAWLTLKVKQAIDIEEHTLFIAEITDGGVISKDTPMTYKYYHEKMKGSAPKAAPTYIEPKKAQEPIFSKAFRCKICGYVYQGDISKEPVNFVCPVCKQPKSSFEEISYA